jgi:hypothetical protein
MYPKGAHLVYHLLYVLLFSLPLGYTFVDPVFGMMLVEPNHYFFGRNQKL